MRSLISGEELDASDAGKRLKSTLCLQNFPNIFVLFARMAVNLDDFLSVLCQYDATET